MDYAKVGSVFRAVRIRRGMSQGQVAEAAGVSRTAVSTIERGVLENSSLRIIGRVSAALGISCAFEARWRGAETAALLDERHARVVQLAVARLTRLGWQVFPEHTFSIWGERGSTDVLAWHPVRRAVLVIEVKTRLADLQDLLSTMDRKRRLAPSIARSEDWGPLFIGSLLVLPGETWARTAVGRFDSVFTAALPERAAEVSAWLRAPDRDLRGIWFLKDAQRSTKRRRGGVMRVRPRRPSAASQSPRSEADSADPNRGAAVGKNETLGT
jgi:transcriptional regulator with XRE-family HTH domain